HEPDSSHYQLLRAFTDDATLSAASAALASEQYRTHEFGDSVLIETIRAKADTITVRLKADTTYVRLQLAELAAGDDAHRIACDLSAHPLACRRVIVSDMDDQLVIVRAGPA